MKLAIVSLVVASVGLANASPMRVVYVSSNDLAAAAAANNAGVAQVVRPVPAASMGFMHPTPQPLPNLHLPYNPIYVSNEHTTNVQQKKPCGGSHAGRLRQKATKLVMSIKVAFGFAPAQPSAVEAIGKTPGGDLVRILPIDPLSPSDVPHRHHAQHHHHNDEVTGVVRVHSGHRHHHLHKEGRPGFMMRVHYALMTLGPWEGRAVAFVLGCGIGVLLRMFWVLTVLAFRALRPASSEPDVDYYYGEVALEGEDAEEIFVAPPMYTVPVQVVVDEKVEVKEETK